MEVLADLRGHGHGLDGLGAEVLGVWAGEPDPSDPVDGTGGGQQVGEQGAGPPGGIVHPGLTGLVDIGRPGVQGPQAQGQVASVGVHVLAEQGDLGDPVGGQGLDLGHHLPERPADLGASYRRHDAEGTAVVAPDLDGDPRLVVGISLGGQRRGEGVGVVADRLLEDLHDRAVGTGLGQEFGGPVHVVGSEDDVDMGGPLLDLVPVLLGEATSDGHLDVGTFGLQGLEVPEGPVELVVGVLPDAAGVQHDDVGLVLRCRRDHAVGFQEPGDPLAVVLVHLAPVGTYGVGPPGR